MYERVHHVQLAMPSGEEGTARAFFVDVLGMTEIGKPPVLAARGGAWFRAGGVELHLGVEEAFQPARKAHPGIVVTDLDGLVERLGHAGQPVQWDADFPGFRRIYAFDPSGNRLEFLQPYDMDAWLDSFEMVQNESDEPVSHEAVTRAPDEAREEFGRKRR
jgi:catechol 2,3-dioxygenase-like lactoylglutathione lyase family enzyme